MGAEVDQIRQARLYSGRARRAESRCSDHVLMVEGQSFDGGDAVATVFLAQAFVKLFRGAQRWPFRAE